jgi:hypothetical protein
VAGDPLLCEYEVESPEVQGTSLPDPGAAAHGQSWGQSLRGFPRL